MESIRILHVIGSSKYGGASSIILAIAEMARRQGWQVDILATDPEFQRAILKAGFGLVPLGGIDRELRPWRDLRGVWRLWRFLRANRYTVVQTHSSKGGFIGRLAATLAGVPVVIHTAHGFAIDEFSPWWETVPYVALERLASYWCDSIVSVSEFHRDWGARLGLAPRRKLCAVPNGIRAEAPTASVLAVRRDLGVAAGEFAILCPCRIVPYKGVDDLVRATAQLKALLDGRFHVYFAGSGCTEDECKTLASQLGLNGVTTFLGFRKDIPNLLAAADLVVLPSYREGLSISLLEAMAAGKPVIATTIGSNREVGGALLVPPQSPADLANAIAYLYQHRDAAAQLGRDAAERFHEHYTEEAMIEDYRRLYLELFSSKEIVSVPQNAPASDKHAPVVETRRAS